MGEVKIEIEAENLSGPAFREARRDVEQLGRSGEGATRSYANFGRTMAQTTQLVQRGMNIMTRLDLVQITLEQSGERVRVSQEKYNAAVKDFGPASDEAIRAGRELEAAQVANEKANLRAKISYGLVTVELITMATKIPAAVKGIDALTVSLTRSAAAGKAVSLSLVAVSGVLAGLALASKIRIGPDAQEVLKQRDGLQKLKDELAEIEDFQRRHPTSAKIGTGLGRSVDWLPGEQTTRERMENLRKAIADGEAQIVADAAKFQMDMTANVQGLVGVVDETLSGIGISFASMSNQMQVGLLQNIGADQDLIVKLQALQAQEVATTRAMLDANPALLDQITATNKKGESTEDLVKRLGLTVDEEKKLRDQGRITTEGIISQAEATRRAKDATDDLNDTLAETTTELGLMKPALDASASAWQTYWSQRKSAMTPSGGGASASVSPSGGSVGGLSTSASFARGLSGMNVQALQPGVGVSRTGKPSAAPSMRQTYVEELQVAMNRAGITRIKDAPKSVQDYYAGLTREYGWPFQGERASNHPGFQILVGSYGSPGSDGPNSGVGYQLRGKVSARTSALRSLNSAGSVIQQNLVMAAKGFDGVVTGPTMFMAGERGAEHVQVTPGGRAGGGLQVGKVAVNIYGNADERRVRRGVMAALREHAAYEQQKRLSARRTF